MHSAPPMALSLMLRVPGGVEKRNIVTLAKSLPVNSSPVLQSWQVIFKTLEICGGTKLYPKTEAEINSGESRLCEISIAGGLERITLVSESFPP